jgi:hypothetical protein
VSAKTVILVLLCLLISALVMAQGAREVTVSEIQGVIAAGVKWKIAWQGTDNADGLVGTAAGLHNTILQTKGNPIIVFGL